MTNEVRPELAQKPCRSCGAPMVWVRTEKQRRMPLDAEPVPPGTRGTFVLRDTLSPEGPLAIAAGSDELPGELYYTSHFATCPQAAEHRRR